MRDLWVNTKKYEKNNETTSQLRSRPSHRHELLPDMLRMRCSPLTSSYNVCGSTEEFDVRTQQGIPSRGGGGGFDGASNTRQMHKRKELRGNKYRPVTKRWRTHWRHRRRRQESLWWSRVWRPESVMRSIHDHGIYTAELIHHFLSLSAALGCSTSRLNNAEDLLLCCACVKGRLRLNPVADSPGLTRRSCLKTALL